ncbi:MAG: hypothetical protein ABFC38_06460 [Methanospirillum sp.]
MYDLMVGALFDEVASLIPGGRRGRNDPKNADIESFFTAMIRRGARGVVVTENL